jgi:metal-dependent amidase/aminoacylase/carboxypeptidase family protein
MTGEDFGYYCQKFPSLFYRVGILSEKVESGGLHSPTFALDLDALETSTAIFAGLAIKFSEQS